MKFKSKISILLLIFVVLLYFRIFLHNELSILIILNISLIVLLIIMSYLIYDSILISEKKFIKKYASQHIVARIFPFVVIIAIASELLIFNKAGIITLVFALLIWIVDFGVWLVSESEDES